MDHTPGPWEWHPGDGMWKDPVTLVGMETGETVLHLGAMIYTGSLEVRMEVNHEDAALIAAAPDLLEACQKALGWLLVGAPHANDNGGLLVEQLKTAIAKAKGGTQ